MKNITCLVTILFFSLVAFSQTNPLPCYIKYTYDASGNRINRKFICAPVDDPCTNCPLPQIAVQNAESQSSTDMIDYKVYPNPGSGLFFIQFQNIKTEAGMYVYNSLGQIIYAKVAIEDNDSVDLSKQPSGLYYFVLKTNGKLINKSVVKVD